ncbi:MAG TPA: hypothetical protein VKK31_11225 [Thermoanaerobaculia bacterium]|nr:hypothetical protein [Thermoanaerobaculia bacterium]
MRKCSGFWILVSLLCLLPAHAASVQPSAAAALSSQLEAIFSTPKPILASSCSASATCATTTISCGPISNTGGTACGGMDQDCSNMERGYVDCGSTHIDCPELCPDLCRNYNRQYPGCNYTWSVPGGCCIPQYASCPYFSFCN